MKRNEQLLHAMGGVGLDLVELSELHEPFGGQWRRIGSLAACLVLAAGVTAAALRFAPALTQPGAAREATAEQTADPMETAADVEYEVRAESYDEVLYKDETDLITPLYDLSIDYTDIVGNDYVCRYYVPQLNFDSPDALAINAEIADTFGVQAELQMHSIDGESSLRYTRIGAEEYRSGSVVTLVCHMGTEQAVQAYEVYHFDTETQTQLSNQALLEALGVDTAEYLSALRQDVHEAYLRETMVTGNHDPNTADEAVTEHLWTQYRRTLEQDLTLVQPLYADNDGVVHAIVRVCSAAGTDYTLQDLSVLGEPLLWDSAAEGQLDYRTALTAMWAGDEPHMTLYLADPVDLSASGAYETIQLPIDWYLERFCVLMDSFTWTRQEDACPTPGSMWVNLAGNGVNWTFWDDGDGGFLVIHDPEEGVQFWKADYLSDIDRTAGSTIAQCIRHEYDGAVLDWSQLRVTGSTSDEVCENFGQAFGELLLSQAPGSVYGAADFQILSCEVTAIASPTADGTGAAMTADYQVAVIPALDGYKSWLWAGNSVEGEGEYEGWLILSRQVLLQEQDDGAWVCTEMGTGGVTISTSE